MLTLKELSFLIEDVDENIRVPSPRQLRESLIPVVVEERVDSHTKVSVFQNGYVVYESNGHSTVFPFKICLNGYLYESCMIEKTYLETDYFENKRWDLRVLIECEERMERNENYRIESKNISYSCVAEDWAVLSTEDRLVEELIQEERINELFKHLTVKQKKVMQEYYLTEKTLQEIAVELGTTKQTVSRMIHRAIRRINRKMGKKKNRK